METSHHHVIIDEQQSPLVLRKRNGELRFADLSLNLAEREATRGGARLQLTSLEYDLLALFLRHPRQAFSRQEMCRRVWGRPFDGRSNHVDVAIMALRKKLEDGGRPRLIQTVRGFGYALREE